MKNISRREFLWNCSTALAASAAALSFPGCHSLRISRTNKEEETLQFIHITDSHLDLNRPDTIKWVEMLVKKINRDFPSVDFVLFGGDNFNNNVPGNDDALTLKKIVDGLPCPYYSVRGNKESSPKPANAPLSQTDFARLFFSSELKVTGRDWKLEKGKYTILGLDSTLEQKNNGRYTPETLVFVENELKNHPDRYYVLLNHHPYENFWAATEEKDIHKYVLNNTDEAIKRLFVYPNLVLTLSGHKHLDHVGKIGHVQTIATLGFVVPQNSGNLDDHQFRYIEMKNGLVTEKLVSIV